MPTFELEHFFFYFCIDFLMHNFYVEQLNHNSKLSYIQILNNEKAIKIVTFQLVNLYVNNHF